MVTLDEHRAVRMRNRQGSKLVLYALVTAIVLLPIRFHFFQLVIPCLLFLIAIPVLVTSIRQNRFVYSPLYAALLVFTLIYGFWFLLAMLNKNELPYAFEDSAGFLIYLMFPVLYSYVADEGLESEVPSAVIFASLVVAGIHVTVFAVFYTVFGSVTFGNLMAVNAALDATNFTWEVGSSGGILRANTKCGHFLLLGLALLLWKFLVTKRPIFLALMGVLLVGALLDGHKALIAAIVIFLFLVLPLVLRTLELYPMRFLGPIIVVLAVMTVTFSVFVDVQGWWDRFTSFESSSIEIRKYQISALVDKIAEHPIIGNGFGSHAGVIRNDQRPFMYEVDFLAVMMKLGIAGSLLYFTTYLLTVSSVLLTRRSVYGYVIFAVGIAYFFYMGTNGGFAMSPISSFFHVVLFLLVAYGLQDKRLVSRGG